MVEIFVMKYIHRVLRPPPPSERSEEQVEIIWTIKILPSSPLR